MNRRTLIVSTALGALGLFAGGALLYTPEGGDAQNMSSDGPLLRDHAPTFGPDEAPVTIVEFFDPACEACAAFFPIVKKMMRSFPGQVRLVLRYATFHKPSVEAVRLLEAARRQGAFAKALKRLYETQSRWAPHGRPAEDVWKMVSDLGLDLEKAKSDKDSAQISNLIRIDTADVQAAGVRRTPSFFVNGKPLKKFGVQELYDLIEAEVKASQKV